MDLSSVYGIATILGPIVLLVAFIWVIVRNKQSRIPKDVTEQATKRLYEAEDRKNPDADE